MNNGNWTLKGHYLESCTCKGVCPCLHLADPTEGDCTGLVAWHIDQGVYEDTVLDGLNVVVALYAPGLMADGNWKVVLYLDESGSEPQREALAKMWRSRRASGGFVFVYRRGQRGRTCPDSLRDQRRRSAFERRADGRCCRSCQRRSGRPTGNRARPSFRGRAWQSGGIGYVRVAAASGLRY